MADLAAFGVLAFVLHGLGTTEDEAVFHSGWFTENLLTQALVMLLLRPGRADTGRRRPGPVARAAAALAVIGLLLPPSPLGLTALPAVCYPLLTAVLVLYTAGLLVARSRYARRGPAW